MSLPTFFALHPVFTREALVRHLAETGGKEPNSATVRELLRYHQRTGRILAVRRGLFATVPPGSTPEFAPIDAFLVAAMGCPEGVLAYHAALELHGLAYSTFEEVQVLVPRSQRAWAFRGVNYRPLRAREALGEAAMTLGVDVVDRLGMDIRVTSQARTLVDVLDRPEYSGGWEEVWRSLEGLRLVDLGEVQDYLARLNNATTAALVGFFLEQHREALHVSEAELARLEPMRPKGRHYLNRTEGGRLAKRWNLIVPEPLWRRTWEELG
ncbi:MAG: transcriptional regulator [Holophagaceae bacterium]|nr:transcriptional regulator [Holophagaceae bacterium]